TNGFVSEESIYASSRLHTTVQQVLTHCSSKQWMICSNAAISACCRDVNPRSFTAVFVMTKLLPTAT
ncbi:hypothetical protein NPIL_629181, partial [Nephila pilipes]